MTTSRRTLEIGRQLFDGLRGGVPGFFDSSRWKGRVMDWAMKDEAFKVQLFRFVDVIPSVKTEQELLELFSEYFYSDSPLMPKALKRWVPHKGVSAYVAGKLIKANVTSLAKTFIAGSSPEDALKEITRIREQGRAFCVDLLGETVLSGVEAAGFEGRYLDLVGVLKGFVQGRAPDKLLDFNHEGAIPGGDVSFKVSSFYSRLDPACRNDSIKNIKPPLKRIIKSAGNSLSITFDMEHHNLKNLTFDIFKSVVTESPDLLFPAIAVQAYLKESEEDLKGLIKWAREYKRKIGVRLVKGAYWDYERIISSIEGWPVPVYLNKAETDRNFERLTRLLLENTDIIRPAIASHNIRSISYAMAVAEELGLEKRTLEFQTLYGMAEPVKQAVTDMGFRVRDYLPVGEFLPGMAYLVRRLLENTSNESFLKLSFVDKLDFDRLMIDPEVLLRNETFGAMAVKTGDGKAENKEMESFVNTPLLDFSDGAAVRDFSSVLKEVKSLFAVPLKVPIVIGGNEIFTDVTFPSIDPSAPDRVLAEVSSATVFEVERAVVDAKKVFKEWSGTGIEKRAEYLLRAADWVEKRRMEIAATQVFEVGKSWREADGDVTEAIDFLKFYALDMKRIGKPKRHGDLPGELNHSRYVSRGVVAVISPWNFPLAIAMGMTSAALVTGNTVILKPSSLSPLTTFYIMKAFKEVGLPDGVLQFLLGSGSVVGSGLVKSSGVDVVAFTGSMDVGLDIVRSAGNTEPEQVNVKKVVAEMGGKNAIIVDSSADMDEAVKGVVSSFTGFQGQKCSAASRVILVGGIKEDFIRRLTETVESLTIGHPERCANIIGPVIDKAALKKIHKYIEIGRQEATLHYSYGPVPESGFFVGPTIFTDVSPEAVIAQEEIFGPVLVIIDAADVDEAIDIANSTRFALTGGIYSRSPVSIDKVRSRLRAGNIYINRKITGALVGRQPFGGFKMSGLGSKSGGYDYLLNFLFPVSITENTLRRGFAPEG